LRGTELAGAWQPARTVGGDYFDVVQFSKTRLGICVGDVSGKGLKAALLMSNLQAAFRTFATAQATPAEVCCKLNAFVSGNVAHDKFITFFYAVLDVEKRTLVYENAGHCPALLLRADGGTEFLRGRGVVLGVISEWSYVDETLLLRAEDRLFFYTDGVTEAENEAAEEFSQKKRKRIEECFGWLKTIALMRKVRHRGTLKVDWIFTFACAAYNLVRMRNLMRSVVST